MKKEMRKRRVRRKILVKKSWPRLSVFRSNKYIYGQIIDDKQGKTLVAVGERELAKGQKEATKIERAKQVGKILAQKALKKKIKKIVFDRGSCRYHGRVKAFAEGVREGGLSF